MSKAPEGMPLRGVPVVTCRYATALLLPTGHAGPMLYKFDRLYISSALPFREVR